MRRLALLLYCVLIPVVSTLSGQCKLVADINKIEDPIGASPKSNFLGSGFLEEQPFARLGSFWYFSAKTCKHGDELFRTNGTAAGTTMVMDVNPGVDSSFITNMIVCGNLLYFSATTKTQGRELWRSDGSPRGTYLVRDIMPGAVGSVPRSFVCMGGTLYFSAVDATGGQELFSSKGTSATTGLLKDIYPGAIGSAPNHLFLAPGGKMFYFSAKTKLHGRELFRCQGTAMSTTMVRDFYPGTLNGDPSQFVNVGNKTLFSGAGKNGFELWSTQGTFGSTLLVKDINPGVGSSTPALRDSAKIMGTRREELYFAAKTGTQGTELWKTDGTAGGTRLVADIRPGVNSSAPRYFAVSGTQIFFSAAHPTRGREPYRVSGTTTPVLMRDIQPGAGSSDPRWFTPVPGGVVFVARVGSIGGSGRELWTYTSSRGTRFLDDIRKGFPSSNPSSLTRFSSRTLTSILLTADDGATGRELFRADWNNIGPYIGSKLVKDIEPAKTTRASGITELHSAFGQRLYFGAFDGIIGKELYSHQPGGTPTLIKDIRAGGASSNPREFATCWMGGTKAVTYFIANDGVHGDEVWATDGTTAGTAMLKDVRSGSSGSGPSSLTCSGGKLYFVADDGVSGLELWVSDGTGTGTVLVKDINPGRPRGKNRPRDLVSCKGELFFATDDGTNGVELWKSDGTASGTVMVRDIRSGSLGSNPKRLLCFRGKVVFNATTSAHGAELWMSDGSSTGTVLIRDISVGPTKSDPKYLTECGGYVYFSARTAALGTGIWRTNLTTAGTGLVVDPWPKSTLDGVFEIGCSNDKLYFAATTPAGQRIMCTDGTVAGTKTLAFSPANTNPLARQFTAASNGVYRTARPGALGFEPWFANGKSGSATLVCDLNPGSAGSHPSSLTTCGGRLFFIADDGKTGHELRVIETPGATKTILGEGSAPSFPRLDATNPVLGSTAQFRLTCGPSTYSGFLVVGPPLATPIPLPSPFTIGGADWVGLSLGYSVTFPLAPIAAPGTTINVAVPNGIPFNGTVLNLQAWWTHASAVPYYQTSNGLQIVLGT
jgi:ELWxxDGT repeat protein